MSKYMKSVEIDEERLRNLFLLRPPISIELHNNMHDSRGIYTAHSSSSTGFSKPTIAHGMRRNTVLPQREREIIQGFTL